VCPTGDYRGKTFGPFEATLDALAKIRSVLKEPIYGVLGNHDTIQMVPAIEAMGIRMLLNECEVIVRADQQIFLGGIDDAHFFRADNIEKTVSSIPKGAFSILLSHTPEVYRQAAHASFDLMLSGHTHGGQLCLPDPSRSSWRRYYPAEWAQAHGGITTCAAILRLAQDQACFRRGSIVRRKSPCTALDTPDEAAFV
jgi:hypothetical protein